MTTGLPELDGYRFIGDLGQGTFAQVKLAENLKTKEKVAVKVIDKRAVSDKGTKKRTLREIETMSRMKHPNIIQLKGVVEMPEVIFILLEYASKGELFDLIVSEGRLHEDRASFLFAHAVSALAYCHANNVVHRDLKPENFLIDACGNLKLTDFGFCNAISSESGVSRLKTPCGSPSYAAPEIFRGETYDQSVDVWSMGVNLYAMVTGKSPWGDRSSFRKQKAKIQAAEYSCPSYLSVEVKDLIGRMIQVDASRRPSFATIIKHPWLQRHKSQILLTKRMPRAGRSNSMASTDAVREGLAVAVPPARPTARSQRPADDADAPEKDGDAAAAAAAAAPAQAPRQRQRLATVDEDDASPVSDASPQVHAARSAAGRQRSGDASESDTALRQRTDSGASDVRPSPMRPRAATSFDSDDMEGSPLLLARMDKEALVTEPRQARTACSSPVGSSSSHGSRPSSGARRFNDTLPNINNNGSGALSSSWSGRQHSAASVDAMLGARARASRVDSDSGDPKHYDYSRRRGSGSSERTPLKVRRGFAAPLQMSTDDLAASSTTSQFSPTSGTSRATPPMSPLSLNDISSMPVTSPIGAVVSPTSTEPSMGGFSPPTQPFFMRTNVPIPRRTEVTEDNGMREPASPIAPQSPLSAPLPRLPVDRQRAATNSGSPIRRPHNANVTDSDNDDAESARLSALRSRVRRGTPEPMAGAGGSSPMKPSPLKPIPPTQ